MWITEQQSTVQGSEAGAPSRATGDGALRVRQELEDTSVTRVIAQRRFTKSDSIRKRSISRRVSIQCIQCITAFSSKVETS